MAENKWASIVGKDNVSSEPSVLSGFSKDFSFMSPVMPSLVIKPETAEEIQKIVKLAYETQTPLVPVSSGAPHFKGDTVPSIGGTAIVDLSRMKKIIRIDRPNRVAMVEPGVTFTELIPALQKVGLRLNLPLLPRQTKSVVGSLLEREPVTMPSYQWDSADPLDCIELIFGTGDMFRTGSAAGPGTIEEQWAAGGAQDEPLGPSQISWHRAIQGAQGTLGIVTWTTLRCELLPELEEPFLVNSPKLEPLLEMVHWLIRLRLVTECFILNNYTLSMVMGKNITDGYVLFFNIAGYDYKPEKRIAYMAADMQDTAQKVGVEPVKSIDGISADELLHTVQNPSPEPYWKLRNKGACQDIFFLSDYAELPEMERVVRDTANAAGYPSSEIGIYLQPIIQGTSCHCEFNLFYDPADESECERVRKLNAEAVKKLMDAGAFFSRPYGESARTIINRDAATSAALKKIKNIFDPNNIMNPGKLCF